MLIKLQLNFHFHLTLLTFFSVLSDQEIENLKLSLLKRFISNCLEEVVIDILKEDLILAKR